MPAFDDDRSFTATFVHMVGWMGHDIQSQWSEVKDETPFRYNPPYVTKMSSLYSLCQ